jgi:hypothetical protein
MKPLLSALLVCCLHWPLAAAAETSLPVISNRKPRLDTEGKIVDAHDGCLQKFGDRYYLYGTAYGTTTPFSPPSGLALAPLTASTPKANS